MDLLLILAVIIIPLIAQIGIKINYSKYSKVENGMHMKGEEVARKILDMNGLRNVKINMIGGTLSDYYDPRVKTVNLSPEIFAERSISSAAVAAHECGHAIQDKENYGFLRLRSSLVPVVNFSSKFATVFILLGLFINSETGVTLFYVGIVLYALGLLFQLITLPVEFDASNRARKQLEKCGLIEKKDAKGVKKVLKAAAYTYVANFLATALQILRLVLLSRNRR